MRKLCNITFGYGIYHFGPEITSIATLWHVVRMSVVCMIPANYSTVRHFVRLKNTLAKERPAVHVLIDSYTLSARMM